MSDCPQISLTVADAPSATVSIPDPLQMNLCVGNGGSYVLVTGSNYLPVANLTGIGGLSVFSSGSFVFFSGGAGGGGGDVSQAQLNSLSGFTIGISGVLQQQIAISAAGVTSVNGLSGALTLAGVGGISITQVGQNIFVSGSIGTSTGVTQAQLDSLSGYATSIKTSLDIFSGEFQAFTFNVPTGIDSVVIAYPQPFSFAPIVNPTINVTGNITYYSAIRSVNATNFLIAFSDIIAESGVSVNVIAKTFQ